MPTQVAVRLQPSRTWSGSTCPGEGRHQRQRPQSADDVGPADGGGSAPLEPVVEQRHNRDPTPQPLPKCHHDVGQVEHPQVLHPAEEQEAQPQDEHAYQHHAPGAHLVGQVSLNRAHEAALYPGEGKGEAELGAGPVELALQGHRPHAHSVKQRDRGDGHDKSAKGDKPPPVKDIPGRESAAWVLLRGWLNLGIYLNHNLIESGRRLASRIEPH